MPEPYSLTVSTIIISYNTVDLTCTAIQSVLDNQTEDNINGEIIVVDNNSNDDSVTKIKKQFGKRVQIIENSKNVGFAKANNQGIKHAKGQYILLLNSDAFLHDHALQQLISTFEKNPDDIASAQLVDVKRIDRVGMVSGKLLYADGTIQPQGGALPSLWNLSWWWLWPFPGSTPLPTNHQYHIQHLDFFEKKQQMGWLSGAALMVRKELINEIGGLDEDIFMYAEDVEWAIRANNHHWDIVYSPKAVITHLGSSSGNSDNSLSKEIEGLMYVTVKHWPIWKYVVLVWILRLGALLRWLLFGIILGNEKKQALYQRIFTSTFEKKT